MREAVGVDEVDNPFRPGAGTRPPALLGRDDVIDRVGVELRRALSGRPGKAIVPIGLRGVGKTVLLNRFVELAAAEGMQHGLLEAPETVGFDVQLALRLRRILLDLDAQRRTKQVLRALRVLKTFTVHLPDGSRVALDVDPLAGVADSGLLAEDLTDVLVAVGEAAAERSTGVLLAIDEVQFLSSSQLAALIAAVHRVVQLDLPVVVVGAGLPQLPGVVGEAKSYAERLFEFPQLGPLDPEDARAVILVPARERGVTVTDGAVEAIVDRAEGYPYFLQEWGYRTWNAADGPTIDRATVGRAEPEVIDHLDRNFFRVRFDRLTAVEQAYLRAMASLGPGPHRSGAIAAALGAPVESLGPRRGGLVRKGMLYGPSHGMTAFTVPMFDEFLRRTAPAA